MRIRSISYWINQILAEENKNQNIKEPQTDKDLNYQLALLYVYKPETNKQLKVA